MTEAESRITALPTIPDAGSSEEDAWAKEVSLNFEGGYIKSAYGNIVQTWNLTTELDQDNAINVSRVGYQTERVLKIGTLGKVVNYNPTSYKRYPRRNASGAAGGGAWTFVTGRGSYTARVAGNVEDVIGWIKYYRSQLFDTLFVYTETGAQYGPFNPTLL